MKSYDRNVKNVAQGVHRFFYRAYNNIHISGPALDLQELQNSGLMITAAHRSMADYYLLGMLMHDLGIGNLRFAAGDNLTKLPFVGPKFRAFGAFTIDRDFGFNRSYFKQLCDRVVAMIDDNDSVIVFPEGGRSYHGNMMELKGGVIAAAVVAQARNPQKKIYMLPITFSYERLYELPYFDMLEKGKKLRKRANPFIKRLLGGAYYFGADIIAFLRLYCNYKLARKQGDIFIDYHAPISVSDLVDINANIAPNSNDDLFAHKKAIQLLGNTLRQKLQALYRLLPMHVAAYCISKHPTRFLTDLQQAIGMMVSDLTQQKRNTKSLAPLSSAEILEAGIRQLSFYRAISVRDGAVRVLRPSIIDYYAAAIS
jgi:1-acyl-sn-glycerol-3-phosphate acyltransferase